MTTELEQSIETELRARGYDLTFELERDDFDGMQGSHSFMVTVTRNGCGNCEYTTEWTAGCAHRHFKGILGGRGRDTPIRLHGIHSGYTIHDVERNKQYVPNDPTLTDVIGALVLDASCVDYNTFESFCEEFGYDTDSRKAYSMYHACRDTYFALRALGADLEELSELFKEW